MRLPHALSFLFHISGLAAVQFLLFDQIMKLTFHCDTNKFHIQISEITFYSSVFSEIEGDANGDKIISLRFFNHIHKILLPLSS